MKKAIVFSLCVLFTLTTFAHLVKPECWSNGRATFSGTLWEPNKSYKVHINTAGITFANGSKDSVYKVGNFTTVNFSVPQPVQNSPVNITVYYNTNQNGNGGSISPSSPITANTGKCNLIGLPVIFGEFTATKTGSAIILEWTTTSEQNNSYFNIQGSTDGLSWQTLARVNSAAVNGNSSIPLNYSYTLMATQKAGIGIMGGILLMGILFSRLKTRKQLLTGCVILLASMFSLTACTKVIDNTPKQSNYTYFRLQQVDIDGTIKNSQIKIVR